MGYEINLGNGEWATGQGGMAMTVTDTDTGVKEALLMGCDRNSYKTAVNKDGLLYDVLPYEPSVTYVDGVGVLNNEPQALQSFTYTEDFTQAGWILQNLNVGVGGLNPRGDGNMQKLIPDTSSSSHRLFKTITPPAGSRVVSMFVRANGYNFLNIQSSVSFARFNLGTKEVISGEGEIEDLGNGLLRLGVYGVFLGTSTNFLFQIYPDSTFSNFAGDGVSGIDMWGANLTEGSKMSSYIRNLSTGTKTRLADTGFQTPDISKWLDDSSIYMNVLVTPFLIEDSVGGHEITLSDGSLDNRIRIFFDFSPRIIVSVVTGGVVAVDYITSSINPSSENNIEFTINGTDVVIKLNESVVGSINNFAGFQNNLKFLSLNRGDGVSNHFDRGYVKSIKIES